MLFSESVEAVSRDSRQDLVRRVLQTYRPVVTHSKKIALLEQKANQQSQPGTGLVLLALKNRVYAFEERIPQGLRRALPQLVRAPIRTRCNPDG